MLCLFVVVPGCGQSPCRAAAQPHLVVQVNEWQEDWPTFFARHRLQAQLDLIEKDYADREARELWSQLQVGADVTLGDRGCPHRWLRTSLVKAHRICVGSSGGVEPGSRDGQVWTHQCLTIGLMGNLGRGWYPRTYLAPECKSHGLGHQALSLRLCSCDTQERGS